MMSSYRSQSKFPTSSEDDTPSSSNSSSDDNHQTVLGVLCSPTSKYLIQSNLGEGVYGTVIKCLKTATKETVAVKIMKSSDFTEEAMSEVDVLRKLSAFDSDRFNFVRYNDSFINNELLCLEFEMLDISLMDYMEKKPLHCLSLKEIRPVLQQMATALQLLRSIGVVHTDLKPDNIMLVDHVNQPLKVKVIDFGMARHISDLDQEAEIQALGYRSPEVLVGSPPTTAIDMWSLGCIVAELFLGNMLYPGTCEYDVLQYISQTQGQLPQKILNKGLKTKWYFKKRKVCRNRQWRLMSPCEYGQPSSAEARFSSLDQLKDVRPIVFLSEEDTRAESEDRDLFIDLLKKMLHLDLNKRILPREVLEDPFLTMNDLASNFPNSFYVKSSCEMMEVCQDPNYDNKDPQPSTSTAIPDRQVFQRVPSAWQSRYEHPSILGVAKAVSSSLSIHEDSSPSVSHCSGFVRKERTRQEQQLPTTSNPAPEISTDTSLSGETKPKSPLQRAKRVKPLAGKPSHSDSEETEPRSEASSPEKAKPRGKGTKVPVAKKKKMKTNKETSPEIVSTDNSKDASTEATSSPAEVKPQKVLTRAAVGAQKKNSLNSGQAPAEAPTTTKEVKPRRKRKWNTFVAGHGGVKSPAVVLAKKMRMDPDAVPTPENPKEALTKATSRKAEAKSPKMMTRAEKKRNSLNSGQAPPEAPKYVKLPRKRKWETVATQDETLSPAVVPAKKMRMGPDAVPTPENPKEAPTKATSRKAEVKPLKMMTRAEEKKRNSLNSGQAPPEAPKYVKPRRKRKWQTGRSLEIIPTKRMRMDPEDTSSTAKGEPKMKISTLDSKQAASQAPASTKQVKPQRKRTGDAFVAGHGASCRSPDVIPAKRMKMDPDAGATPKVKPRRRSKRRT